MARCYRIQNPIGQLRTFTILYTFAFVITRHTWNRCVYLLVIVIFAVVACTIKSSIKTYLLSPFLIISWWIGTFCDHVIFRSASIAFPRRTFRIYVRWNTNRVSFLLFLSNPFEFFFHIMVINSKKIALCLDLVCYLIMSTRPRDTVVKIQVISLKGWNVQIFLIRIIFLSSQLCLVAC